MYMLQRSVQFVRGFLLSYGPTNIKKRFWDQDFSAGKWDFIDNTEGDCVYTHLERYTHNGSILDLGCGPGNTANELAANAYGTYTGVDISEAALAKANSRTAEMGRSHKNQFVQGDFIKYEPSQQFDVILFRESMYHVPLGKVRPTLDRYAGYLKKGGVFIVRLYTTNGGQSKRRPLAMIRVIEEHFDVLDKQQYDQVGSKATVITFRPKAAA